PPPRPASVRVAVTFTFGMDADSIVHLSHHAVAATRAAAMAARRYEPQVAVPRPARRNDEAGYRIASTSIPRAGCNQARSAV
ncbi:MAG: hypothetical protein OXD35_05625, partial [Thiotrichales bacterium]|nr:hypothetical protein [Thiotrichales bacterium]